MSEPSESNPASHSAVDLVRRRNHKAEADRASEHDRRFEREGITLIPRDEVVTSQPRQAYRHPPFVEKTAPPDEVAELDALLDRLWTENQDRVGEYTLEVHAWYAETGAADELEEGLRSWADRYLRRRSDPSRLTPQVRGDPFLLLDRVIDELARIADPLASTPGAVNSRFLQLWRPYAEWLLTARLVSPYVREVGEAVEIIIAVADVAAAHRGVAMYDRVAAVHGTMPRAMSDLSRGRRPDGPQASGRSDHTRIRTQLEGLAEDLQQMRPFLGLCMRPELGVFQVADRCWAGWGFTTFGGGLIGFVGVGESEQAVVRGKLTATFPGMVGVNRAGLFCNYFQPWRTVSELETTSAYSPIEVNLAILTDVHAKLFESYDRIDFDQVRSRAMRATASPGDVTAALNLSAIELAAADPGPTDAPTSSPAAPTRRIPSLRFSRLARLLADRFGCEVGGGKGSEVKVFRPGGRIYVFGHHKADFDVHPSRIRPMLTRLGIEPADWLAVVRR